MSRTISDNHPVLVGVDGSASTRAAALWAADLAALWQAPLYLIHLVENDQPDAESIPPTPGWLRELGAAAERVGVDPTVTEVRHGSPIDYLAARCDQARALVLGSEGGEGWAGALAGPHALPLVERCACPLITVRGHQPGVPPPRQGPIVVGVDGTATGDAALEFAADLASRGEHRHLVVVHTWSEIVRDLAGRPHKLAEDPDKLAERATEMLEGHLRPVLAAHPELTAERQVLSDTPLRALLNRAPQAWLLVVGRRSTRAEATALVGSTSRGLIEFAPCPVAVMPPVPDSPSTSHHQDGDTP